MIDTEQREHPGTDTRRLDLRLILPSEPATCEHCLGRLEAILRSAEGVSELQVDRERGTAVVHYDPVLISGEQIEEIARREGLKLDERYAHRVIPVEGMDCTGCAQTLENGVGRLPGIEWTEVNFAGARMAVEYDADRTDMDAISRRVTDLGYRVGDDSIDEPEHQRGAVAGFLSAPENRQTLAAAVLALAGGGVSLSPAPAIIATLFYAAAILIAGVPIARKALATAWTARQLDINMLMTIAVIGAAFIGEWLEAAAVVVLFSLGEALEGFSMDRARRSIRSLMQLAPAEAVVRRDGQEQQVPVSEISPGDIVVVRAGERVPVDGVIATGASTVNQAPITGESVPVEKETGAEVFSGSVNGAGVLEIHATRPASDSTIARIIRMVEDAQAQRAPTQRFVDVFAKYYTPAVVVLAAVIAVAPPLLAGAAWSPWIYRSLVLLVIACPCALVISTPVSIVSAISAAARNGVLIKGGAYLEAAGSLRALAFDKTGTLTQGMPSVVSIIPTNGMSEDDLLRYAAAAERYSEHPLGEAIVRAGAARQLDVDTLASAGTVTHSGRGIESRIGEKTIRVGTRGFILNGNATGEIAHQLAELEDSGQTAVLVAQDDQVIGIIGLADELRPDAEAAIRAVKDAGIQETIMLSGDRQSVARSIGSRIGIDTVEAELLPDQKVEAIERLLRRHERVGMVGDGVNDAPALARSSVGIAMGAAGSDTALETADIALMSDDLSKVSFTMRLSRAARRIIAQNVGLSLAIKAVFLLLAVGGAATLWQAVFADVGAALIVIANGMRLFRADAE